MSRFDAALLERARRAVDATLRGLGKPAPAPPEPATPTSAVDIALALARRFEGCVLHPHLCPAGVPSIGFGATYYLDGRRVQLTDPPISRAAAERLLLLTIERDFLPAVLRLCPRLRYATPERLAAIIDFTFNLGSGRLATSTLRRRINDERWDDVPAELRKWIIGGGVVLRGLVLRREAEAALV
jgi:lysozyme